MLNRVYKTHLLSVIPCMNLRVYPWKLEKKLCCKISITKEPLWTVNSPCRNFLYLTKFASLQAFIYEPLLWLVQTSMGHKDPFVNYLGFPIFFLVLEHSMSPNDEPVFSFTGLFGWIIDWVLRPNFSFQHCSYPRLLL